MDTNGYKVIKLMQFENQLLRLNRDVEKLVGIAAQHGAKIKELVQQVGNSVTQVEFMSAITTTRFQNLNVVSSMKQQDAKEESPPTNANNGDSSAINESRDNEIKQLKNQVTQLENELYQSNFRYAMDTKKMENEIKINRKEFFEMKNYLTSMEKKLEKFVQAVEEVGISTNVTFVDPNKAKAQPTRKSSFLNVSDQSATIYGSVMAITKEESFEESEQEVESRESIHDRATDGGLESVATTTVNPITVNEMPSSSTNHAGSKKQIIQHTVADLSSKASKAKNQEFFQQDLDPRLLYEEQTIITNEFDGVERIKKRSIKVIPNRTDREVDIDSSVQDQDAPEKTLSPIISSGNGFNDSFDENDSLPAISALEKRPNAFHQSEKEISKKIFFQRFQATEVDVYDDYRSRLKLLFEKITAVKSVEELSRTVASSSVASSFNKIQDIMFSNFERSYLNQHFRHVHDASTIHRKNNYEEPYIYQQPLIKQYDSVALQEEHVTTLEAPIHARALTETVAGRPPKVEQPPVKISQQHTVNSFKYIQHAVLKDDGDDDKVHFNGDPRNSSFVINDDAVKELAMNGMHQVELQPQKKQNGKDEKRQFITVYLNKEETAEPSALEPVNLNDSGDEFLTQSMGQLEPLSLSALNSISTDSRDFVSRRDETVQAVNKKLQKICVEINKRMENIDEHTAVLNKNCTTLHHKYEKLQHQYNTLVCQFDNLQNLQIHQADRVIDLTNNQKLVIDPLSDCIDNQKRKIIELEQVACGIVNDLSLIKKDCKRIGEVLDKNNTNQGFVQNNIEISRRAHVETRSSEFELENLQMKIHHYEKRFHDLHGQYEFVLEILSTLVEDSQLKSIQLLPKSKRDKIHQLVSSRQKCHANKSLDGAQRKETESSLNTNSIVTKQISELKHELGLLREIVHGCLNVAQLSQARDDKTEAAILKSPMRNRKLVEFVQESMENNTLNDHASRKISPRAVPSLMNGKYLVRGSSHEMSAMKEIELKLKADGAPKDTVGIQWTPMPPVVTKNMQNEDQRSLVSERDTKQDENQYKSIWFHDFTPWHQAEES